MRATTVALFFAVSGCTMPMTPTDTGPDAGSDGGLDSGAGDSGAGDSGAGDSGAGDGGADVGSDAGPVDVGGTNPLCVEYCDWVLMACGAGMGPGQYADHAECLFVCAEERWRDGMAGDTTGNTIQCRIYHATMAFLMPDVHCAHADRDGGGVCTD